MSATLSSKYPFTYGNIPFSDGAEYLRRVIQVVRLSKGVNRLTTSIPAQIANIHEEIAGYPIGIIKLEFTREFFEIAQLLQYLHRSQAEMLLELARNMGRDPVNNIDVIAEIALLAATDEVRTKWELGAPFSLTNEARNYLSGKLEILVRSIVADLEELTREVAKETA